MARIYSPTRDGYDARLVGVVRQLYRQGEQIRWRLGARIGLDLDDLALRAALGFDGAIARKGVPSPIQAGSRWVVERAHGWMHGDGKLRRCTGNLRPVIDFYLVLAAALVVLRQLIQRARLRYRWDTRPSSRRLK